MLDRGRVLANHHQRGRSTSAPKAKDPDLYNAAGKLMCYAHYEGRCNKSAEECGKSHGTPTARQLVKYNEHKARAQAKPKPAGKPPAVAKAGPVPNALPAPAPDTPGPIGAPMPKPRGRSRGRSESKGRTPETTTGAVAVPIAGFPGTLAPAVPCVSDTFR